MSKAREALEALKTADPVAYQRLVEEQRKYAFTPHSQKQNDILNHPARFKVVRAGRRFGKTKVAARALVRHALRNPGTVDWWVGNVYHNTRRGYREVLRQLPPSALKKEPSAPTANVLIIELKNGSRLEFYSGTKPDSMAGEGVGYVVVDEAALQSELVWTQTIRATLMDQQGGAMLISTPRGRNWFWKLYKQGEDPLFPDWAAFHATSYDNPLIERVEIEEARAGLPEAIFNQEYMAEFVSDGARIFSIADDFLLDDIFPVEGQPVVMGLDLAKREDFTVISASRVDDRMPVYHDRFNQIRWPDQRQLIIDAEKELRDRGAPNVTIMVDATGVGDVVFDDLEDAGLDVIPIKFTNDWKARAVKLLASDLQQGNARILARQLPEFEAYEFSITDAGRIRYSAPEGGHDDEVSAKLLEHWGHVHEHMGEGLIVLNTRPEVEKQVDLPAHSEIKEIKPRTTEDLINDPAVWG